MSTQLNLEINKNFLLKTKIMLIVFCVILILQLFGGYIAYHNGIAFSDLFKKAFYVPLVLIVIVLDQFYLIKYIKKKINNNKPINHGIIYLASLIESAFPTAVIAYGTVLASDINQMTAVTILNSPPEYLYFIFIVLSTLLLDAKFTIVLGIVCSLEYFLLVYFLSNDESTLANYIYLFKPAIMVLFSVVTGLISKTIRSSVLSSMEAQRKHIEELDMKVKERTLEIYTQKNTIEEKQKEILDSINYAKRIQYTLLAHADFLKQNLPDHFTFFNPKDIVSGDFYWATKYKNKFYLAVCDSTGHGVPGAFMSLLNIGFLTEAINEKGLERPNEVFDFVRQKLTETISKEGQKDGFDGILVCFDTINKAITYSSANNKPILISDGKLMELQTDRMPVGVGERNETFTLHTINANPGDVLYLYTDGYADQFGGPKGKKFKYKQLNELLASQATKPMEEQGKELKNSFEKWKGALEQVDDVCIIGIKISY